MTLQHLSETLAALTDERIRFLIAGGLAVLAHGHSRVTHDLDLVLSLDPENTRKAILLLTRLGFAPRIPVDPLDFCDPAIRRQWIAQKNLQVFSLTNADMTDLVIDLFATEPFDFDKEWEQAAHFDLPGFPPQLPFVSKPTLLAMKQQAGRPIDLDDIQHLQKLP